MADVAANLYTWSTTESSNSPSGTTTIGGGLDDNLRQIQTVVRQDLAHKGNDVASSSTADVGAVIGLMHDITGTTTITSLGTVSAGIWKILKFEGALTLTHNATSLILPGGANITTANGDIGIFISEGSGNWRCVTYEPVGVTGSGSTVKATSPTLVTPAIGTPSSGTLTNCTNLPQGGLKTTTASGNVTVTAGASASYTLTGGTYSWWTAGATAAGGVEFGNGDVAAGVLGLKNNTVTDSILYVDERYVQASPPYNLGHGDIPLFVFAKIDSLGNIRAVSVAPDPTWAYHGPTDIRPERTANGKAYRRYREINGIPFATAVKNGAVARAFLDGSIEAVFVEREITYDIKNRDMDLFPHPWAGNVSSKTVVMLDPLSPVVSRLAAIHQEAGAKAASELVNSSILIDNQPLSVKSPAGVITVGCKLK